jgi:hypothetical protein
MRSDQERRSLRPARCHAGRCYDNQRAARAVNGGRPRTTSDDQWSQSLMIFDDPEVGCMQPSSSLVVCSSRINFLRSASDTEGDLSFLMKSAARRGYDAAL